MLPGLDGFFVMAQPESQEVLVIFLSAMQQAVDYIFKPIEPLELPRVFLQNEPALSRESC